MKHIGEAVLEAIYEAEVLPVKVAEEMGKHPTYLYHLKHRPQMTCSTVAKVAQAIRRLKGEEAAKRFLRKVAEAIMEVTE